MNAELIKRYRNCELWASYTVQDSGQTIAYFTVTSVGVKVEQVASDYMWLPALWLSGGTLEECRARVASKRHGEIMCQVLWAS